MLLKEDMQWSNNLNTVVNTFQWISPVLGTGMAKYLIEEGVREELISEVLLLPTKRTYIEKNASPFYIFLCKMQTKKNNTHKKSLPLEAGTIPNHKPWNNTMKFRPSRGWGDVERKLNTHREQNLQK